MIVSTTIGDCRAQRAKLGSVAFVPTMGALHEGHLSLISAARQRAQRVAVSIFVNPTQFGPSEDFSKYPRPIEQDLALCQSAGVDLVFNPAPQEMYRADSPGMTLDFPQLTTVLEGAHRPGHFMGVCQVVAKLFNILQPQIACFGMKDFQQLCVLQAMVGALDFPVEIVPCPTVREADGLAMSSRNRYLSPEQRQRAVAISRALFAARDAVRAGEHDAAMLLSGIRSTILDPGQFSNVSVSIDYVACVDPKTLAAKAIVDAPTLFPVAARVGATRLIDNLVIDPTGR